MKMRTVFLLSLFIAGAPLAIPQASVAPQSQASSALEGMRARTWTERSRAFAEARALLNSGKLTQSDIDQLHLGVTELLKKENNGGLKEPDNISPENYNESYGEEKSEYYGGLIAFVAELKDERAIPALLGAAGTGGTATHALAQFGSSALDLTIAQAKSQNVDLASGALFVLLEMLKMRTISDSASHASIKRALQAALTSPEHSVREDALSAIEYMDDREDFVPMLQNIAQNDPYKLQCGPDITTCGNENLYVVRKAAKLLLGRIANHQPAPRERAVAR